MKKAKLNIKKVCLCMFILPVLVSGIVFGTQLLFSNINLAFYTNLIPSNVATNQNNEFSYLPYYQESLLERYLAYQIVATDLSIEDIVTHVNMGIDSGFYQSDPIIIEDPDALDVLANKFYKIPEHWEPSNLVLVNPIREQYLNIRAADAFHKFQEACRKQGFTITVYSGYRSIAYQNKIYSRSVSINGEEETDKYIARPGHSEHATGLSIDISIDGIYYEDIENSPHYTWFRDNLSDYGFILRYPENKEHLTGYHYESWHIRYLGKDLAKKVEASGLTYDEYVARHKI